MHAQKKGVSVIALAADWGFLGDQIVIKQINVIPILYDNHRVDDAQIDQVALEKVMSYIDPQKTKRKK